MSADLGAVHPAVCLISDAQILKSFPTLLIAETRTVLFATALVGSSLFSVPRYYNGAIHHQAR